MQAASHPCVRASLAVFTVIVLLLIQSAFWSARVSGWMQAIIFAMALLSYFRPHYGLLAVAALAPFAQVGSRTLAGVLIVTIGLRVLSVRYPDELDVLARAGITGRHPLLQWVAPRSTTT